MSKVEGHRSSGGKNIQGGMRAERPAMGGDNY